MTGSPEVGEYYKVDFRGKWPEEHNGIGVICDVYEHRFKVEIIEGFEHHKNRNGSNFFTVDNNSPFHHYMKKIKYNEKTEIPAELSIKFSDFIN